MRIGALGLLLCGWMTAAQVPTWRSDRAVWARAYAVSPNLPRPALNYAFALLKAGEIDGGLLLLVRAGELAAGHSREREVRALVRHRLWWLEAFGTSVCSRPTVQPHCS